METGSKTNQRWFQDGRWLLCLLLILLGIAFRYGNLHQVYWHDEAYTSLRLSGHTALEVRQQVFTGKLVPVAALRQFQWPQPDKTVGDTIRVLALDDAQHPPVYYGLARQWVSTWGHSRWVLRSLSVLISLLEFPTLYWLCQELGAIARALQPQRPIPPQLGPTTGAIALGLVAVSPFHLLYAQEAREYSLWTVLILVLGASFLRAVRLKTRRWWGIYAASLAFSLYTHPFTGFVALGQVAYLLIVERFKLTRRAIAGLLAISGGLLIFSPWLSIVVATWRETGANWTAQPIPWLTLLQAWGLHLVRLFALTPGDFGFASWQLYLLLPVLLLLSGYALYFLCRQVPWPIGLFLLLLMGASCLPLLLPDLLLGGQRSTAGRYLIPTFLGLQVAIALLFADKLQSKAWVARRFWQALLTILLLLGVWSGLANLQAETSWSKVVNYSLPAISRPINASPQPVLIGFSHGINFGTILALSHVLDPDVRLLLIDDGAQREGRSLPSLPPDARTVFLLNPPPDLLHRLERREATPAKLLFQDFHLALWQLTRPLSPRPGDKRG
jgi:uncharacterized membrane protein